GRALPAVRLRAHRRQPVLRRVRRSDRDRAVTSGGAARARRWRDAAPIAAASLLVAGMVHTYMWNTYLPAFNTPHTPLEGVAHARSVVPPGPALTRRLAVVVVDGVGFDQVGRIGELAALRDRGVFRGTAVEFPSFTSPALTSFVTGTVPRDSGVRLNGAE